MKTIANSLLQLATLRNYTPIKTEIDVKRLFDEIAQTMSKPVNEHGTQFIFKARVDVLSGQEDLVKSLLLNLCFNGLKACLPGAGIVILEAKRHDNGVELSVADNGSGIPKESIAKVIEPFYRVDKARRPGHGVGLGLTLCKQIADIHGALMTIDSTEGIGTTVKIFFTTSQQQRDNYEIKPS